MEMVRYVVENGWALLSLNRPEVLNSFNAPMRALMRSRLEEAAGDQAVRCLLLTGEGRAFCAGQDLAEAIALEGAGLSEVIDEGYNPIVRAICGMEKPVVCAVNGVAAGAGANIALACDIVLASSQASFIQSFSNIGLVPDSGGTFFLPRLAGLPRARALALLGEKISAQQAYDWGMVYSVLPPQELMPEAQRLAQHLATRPTRGLALTKKALLKSLSNTLHEQLELERELQAQAANTEDYREGVSAFLEKRKPVFGGK